MRIGILLLLLGFGCTIKEEEIAGLGYIKKSQFEGEWITNATTVAKQSHSSFAFTGLRCSAERVKFVITENQLLAFKSHSNASVPEEESRDQALVAAFNILEHADAKDGLSWREKGYMKVDWSKNLAPHVDCNGWLSSITAVSVKNNDQADPLETYRVRIEDDYMENTVDAIVVPDEATCEEVGDWRCNPAEYRVKYSFMKVKNNDYEPWNYQDNEKIRFGANEQGVCVEGEAGCKNTKELWLYSDARGEVVCDPLKHDIDECYAPSIALNSNFGFFRTTSQSYDRKEGFNRLELKNWINRYNLWQKSRNEDGTLIPLVDRLPKKITYYLNPGFPSSLYPAVKKVESEWNTAFANVIAKIRDRCTVANVQSYLQQDPKLLLNFESQGIKTIGSYNLRQACSIIYEWTKNLDQSEVFFTGDPHEIEPVFGKIFEIRVNDCNDKSVAEYIKTNHLNVLSEHGILDINDDNIEKACAVLEWASSSLNLPKFSWQQPGDIRYSFINAIVHPDGNLLGYGPAVVDPVTGEIISATANIYLSAISEFATRSVMMMDDMDEIKDKLTAKDETDGIDDFKDYVIGTVNSMSETTYKMPKTSSFQMANLSQALKLNLFPSLGDWSHSLSSLSDDFGIDGMVSAIAQEKATVDNNKKIRVHDFLSKRSACFFEPSDNLLYDRLRKDLKGQTVEQKIEAFKSEIFMATLMHELGHTFGLRHNFKAKSYALNYPPNFWGVDTKDFRMRPGLSQEELRSSSTMDYHKRFNSDFFGLGLYDYAALLLGYGQKMEVFDSDEEDFVPHDFIESLNLMHYKDLPYLFSGSNANQKVKYHFLKVKDDFLMGKKSAHMQLDKIGLKGNAENLYKRKVVDYVKLKKQKLESSLGVEGKEFTPVPYGFCTDGQARKSDIFCQPFIYGSSASEIVENQIKDYELATTVRRVKARASSVGVGAYLRSLYGNIYAPILRSYQQMYAAAGTSKMIFPAIHDYAVSAKRGLEFISEVLQAVEPGTYCKNAQGNYELKKPEESCLEPVEIDEVVGKPYRSSFNDDLLSSPKRIGYVYDKILALLALIDDKAVLEDDFSSWRKNTYSIGFYRIFAPQLIHLFANLYTDQWENLAPSITVDENKQVHIKYRDLFKLKNDSLSNQLPKIMPSHSSTMKDYAILLSMTGLSNPVDHKLNFAKRAQISTRVAGVKSTGSKDEVSFIDPYSGVRYRALVTEDKDIALGYQLLKDAYDFVNDGHRTDEQKGPWFIAKSNLARVKDELSKELMASISDREKIIKLKEEQKKLTKEFMDKDRSLREKVRVIEKVQALSEKFAD